MIIATIIGTLRIYAQTRMSNSNVRQLSQSFVSNVNENLKSDSQAHAKKAANLLRKEQWPAQVLAQDSAREKSSWSLSDACFSGGSLIV